MKIESIEIKNFKAIKNANLELADFNVVVGENGSGKSSVLQAIHWVFQSGKNTTVKPSEVGKGSTLSEKDAVYIPSPSYKNTSFGAQQYGNNKHSPQLDLSVVARKDYDTKITANMWIKAARNEGVSVHVPSKNEFVSNVIRDKRREVSAYIPGLAGIPLSEEKKSKLVVHRLAAAGDANTVLRNILLLLRGYEPDSPSGDGLEQVAGYVSQVLEPIALKVDFQEDRHIHIEATFQTQEMKKVDPKKFKPLELAGVGFLQVIQIFSYLVYFRPRLLLVDEPDAHLHPTAQEKLTRVLALAAQQTGTQVILSTHSPSVVRALPPEAKVIWMKDGKVHPDGNTHGRKQMGWGLLDKRIILMTEDKDTKMLQALLAQWPELHRAVAIWPFNGCSKLPSPDVINGLLSMVGEQMKAILHRDRDFLMQKQMEAIEEAYKKNGHQIWFTKNSDIEAYWCEANVIEQHFKITKNKATGILRLAACRAKKDDKHIETVRKKMNDNENKIDAQKKGKIPKPGEDEVLKEAAENGDHHIILGKELLAQIRKVANEAGLKGSNSFGNKIPKTVDMAQDLKELLTKYLR